MDIDFKKLQELNLQNIGEWPKPIKLSMCALVLILLLFLGYWFDTSEQVNMLSKSRALEGQLWETISIKQQQAANLPNYQQALQQINKVFEGLLQRLPTQTEIPGLLEDISRAGAANGLEFKSFKPLPEVQGNFYVELPIQIAVVGNYHQLAKFVSDIVNFDRIITIHDFSIGVINAAVPGAAKDLTTTDQGKLLLEMTAKTYRYQTEAEHLKNSLGVKNKS